MNYLYLPIVIINITFSSCPNCPNSIAEGVSATEVKSTTYLPWYSWIEPLFKPTATKQMLKWFKGTKQRQVIGFDVLHVHNF